MLYSIHHIDTPSFHFAIAGIVDTLTKQKHSAVDQFPEVEIFTSASEGVIA